MDLHQYGEVHSCNSAKYSCKLLLGVQNLSITYINCQKHAILTLTQVDNLEGIHGLAIKQGLCGLGTQWQFFHGWELLCKILA